jgi:hypothetical protein
MYEEPDYALQCVAAGYDVLFSPIITIRHHYSGRAAMKSAFIIVTPVTNLSAHDVLSVCSRNRCLARFRSFVMPANAAGPGYWEPPGGVRRWVNAIVFSAGLFRGRVINVYCACRRIHVADALRCSHGAVSPLLCVR